MNKNDDEAFRKRLKIQQYFWEIVGSSEHINLPKLEDAIVKEFHFQPNDRAVQHQINLMQTEGRIRIQSNAKVWIKKPTI